MSRFTEEEEQMLVGFNVAFEKLREDPVAWAAYQAEVAWWDAISAPITHLDGTLAEPYYGD